MAARCWPRRRRPTAALCSSRWPTRSRPTKFSGNAAQALAELDDSQGKFTDALPLWQKALALATDPATKATAAARGGWSALQAKRLEDAEKLFVAARKNDASGQSRAVANTGLLRVLFLQKRYAEWLDLYAKEKDRTLDTARAEILYDLGHANFSLKRWKDAVAGFDQYLLAFSTEDAAVTAGYERFLADTQIDRARAPAEGDAYLKSWPKSPYRAKVRLVQAQELSREKKFSDALPLWENLATDGDSSLPRPTILLELARAYDETGNFPKAATAYQAFLDDTGAHPGAASKQVIAAQARLAVCLQNANQLLGATDAWKTLLSIAPGGSPEQEEALESLGLIYAKGGPAQESLMVATFRQLLSQFPQSPLRAMAAFTVGDSLFKSRDYAGAEPLLIEARTADPKTWAQPATQRLVLGAYGRKDFPKTVDYLHQYEPIYDALDPQVKYPARLPGALYYWLAQNAQKAGQWQNARPGTMRRSSSPTRAPIISGRRGGSSARCRATCANGPGRWAATERRATSMPAARTQRRSCLRWARRSLAPRISTRRRSSASRRCCRSRKARTAPPRACCSAKPRSRRRIIPRRRGCSRRWRCSSMIPRSRRRPSRARPMRSNARATRSPRRSGARSSRTSIRSSSRNLIFERQEKTGTE
ncbi:MAG: tetratricopeptide repeat protein [Verrucomicrobiota bacterium]